MRRDIEHGIRTCLDGGRAGLPVVLEDVDHLSHRTRVAEDDANFTAGLHFQLAQALAAQKRLFAVAQDRPDVQTHGNGADVERVVLRADLADDTNVYAVALLLGQELHKIEIADLHFIQQQLLFCPANKVHELGASIGRADNKVIAPCAVVGARDVGLEQTNCLRNHFRRADDGGKRTAERNVHVGVVEGKQP